MLERGQIGDTLETIERCVALAEAAGFVAPQATARADLAAVYGLLGDPERGLAIAREALAVADERTPVARPWVLGVTARLHLLAGDVIRAKAMFDEVGLTVLPEPLRSTAAVLVRLGQANVALAVGDHDTAATAADEVVNVLRRMGIRPYVPDALLTRGRAELSAGRIRHARRSLDEARREAEALGSVRTLWEILAASSDVAVSEGNDELAAELRGRAADLVRRMSDAIGDDHLAATFLSKAEVRSLLATEP